MTDHVLTIKLGTPFTEACRMFQTFNLRHLPVIDDDDKLIGMFSLYDAMQAWNNKVMTHSDLDENKVNELVLVQELMTTNNILTLDREDEIEKAIAIFSKGEAHSILILLDNRICGIVTPNDVLRGISIPASYFKETKIKGAALVK